MKIRLTILLLILLTITFVVFFSISAIAQASPHDDSTNLTNQEAYQSFGQNDLEDQPRNVHKSFSAQAVISYPYTTTLLLEDTGSSITELLPVDLGPESQFRSFYILQENDIFYLWLNSHNYSSNPRRSIEQRFESQDGLIWHNRSNTNLTQSDTYRFIHGIRHVIKNGDIYEGWHQYYYEWTTGWAESVRYITSTNGITWTVVNQPALAGALSPSVIKDGNTYQMWANPDGDYRNLHDPALRYRTSNDPGSGWGDWQTGGSLVNVDGEAMRQRFSRVRQQPDGTYQLFYFNDGYANLNMATSSNGIDFTTQIAGLLDLTVVLPWDDILGAITGFAVVEVNEEDWFYFTYRDQDSNGHIAVVRPIPNLTLNKTASTTTVFPGDTLTYTLGFSNIGNSIATNIFITDIVPSLLTNLNVNSNIPITDTGHTPGYVWQVQNLAPGAEGNITITGQISSDLTSNTIFSNTAIIAGSTSESDMTNNQSTVTVEFLIPALSIVKSVTPDTNVAYQGEVTYTIVLSNSRGIGTIHTFLTDTLPISTTFLRWVEQSGADQNGNQITWNGMITGLPITFTFVANHIGNYGDQVTNIAEYSHFSGRGSAQATFTVETSSTLSISDANVLEGNSGQTNAIFDVILSSISTQPLTVTYSTVDGIATTADDDYIPVNGVISFAPGSTRETITVTINGDTKIEADESFYVNLTSVSGNFILANQDLSANATIADGQGMGIIVNDDLATAPLPTPNNHDDNQDEKNTITSPPSSVPVSTVVPPVSYLPETGSYNSPISFWIILALFGLGVLTIWRIHHIRK